MRCWKCFVRRVSVNASSVFSPRLCQETSCAAFPVMEKFTTSVCEIVFLQVTAL